MAGSTNYLVVYIITIVYSWTNEIFFHLTKSFFECKTYWPSCTHINKKIVIVKNSSFNRYQNQTCGTGSILFFTFFLLMVLSPFSRESNREIFFFFGEQWSRASLKVGKGCKSFGLFFQWLQEYNTFEIEKNFIFEKLMDGRTETNQKNISLPN